MTAKANKAFFGSPALFAANEVDEHLRRASTDLLHITAVFQEVTNHLVEAESDAAAMSVALVETLCRSMGHIDDAQVVLQRWRRDEAAR